MEKAYGYIQLIDEEKADGNGKKKKGNNHVLYGLCKTALMGGMRETWRQRRL